MTPRENEAISRSLSGWRNLPREVSAEGGLLHWGMDRNTNKPQLSSSLIART